MKNITFALLASAVVLGFASSSLAKKYHGGFVGPSSVHVVTVEQAKNMSDDTPVILRGHIESKVGKEDYMFRDTTGTIKVDIDDDDWNGLTVTPDDLVEIHGEVDTHWSKPVDIDVDAINLIQK